MKVTPEELRRLYPELSAATKQVAAVKEKRVRRRGANPWSDSSITVLLPLPSSTLSPNARVHYLVKSTAVRAARTWARLSVLSSLDGLDAPLWPSATVQCTFTFPDRRARDRDNLLASMKSAFDGLADAGIVANDSGFTHQPIVITEPDKTKCGVVVRIQKSEAAQ